MARTTTRSGRREMNPTDAYRKSQRKKEVQKNKKERKKVREFSAMVRNPDLMVEEVRKKVWCGRHDFPKERRCRVVVAFFLYETLDAFCRI